MISGQFGIQVWRGSGGAALKRKSVASGTRKKKSMGLKNAGNRGKTSETPNPNRDKLKEMVEKNLGFFLRRFRDSNKTT